MSSSASVSAGRENGLSQNGSRFKGCLSFFSSCFAPPLFLFFLANDCVTPRRLLLQVQLQVQDTALEARVRQVGRVYCGRRSCWRCWLVFVRPGGFELVVCGQVKVRSPTPCQGCYATVVTVQCSCCQCCAGDGDQLMEGKGHCCGA